MALTQETILTFLLEHGGKAKNSELLNKFKGLINSSDPAEKKQNRDLFKRFVNNVAVVKQIDDVKFVVVKKKYQDFAKSDILTAQKSEFEDSSSCLNYSFSPCSIERSGFSKCESGNILNSDVENNNSCYPSSTNGKRSNGNLGNLPTDCPLQNNSSGGCCNGDAGVFYPIRPIKASPEDFPRAKVLSEIKTGKTGASFAIVATKSPNSQCDELHVNQDKSIPKVLIQETVQQQHKLSMGIQLHQVITEKADPSTNTKYAGNATGVHNLYRSPRTKRRQLEIQISSSPQVRRANKTTTKPEAKYSEVVPLEPTEHEWLVKSATGHWGQVYGLLLQHTQLAEKKDFISGFTALHWAAKSGNSKMMCKIVEISRKSGTEIDINARTHGGYTPLHIAAIHGHDFVITLLVRDYGASPNIRDNSGKKPYHYLHKDVSSEVREMLGDPQVLHQETSYERTEDNHYFPELPKSFNTWSRLFQPHTGYKKKHRHRPNFHFLSHNQDDDQNENALNHRLFH